MKVSVIVPNYNHAPFLKMRIDSILNQTYQDFELIIMDDCSTDDSVAVIETYRSHPKVTHILLNVTNSGSTFKQWKKGIEKAQGHWIWIAESDDFCEPVFLETLMQLVQDKPRIGLAYCQSVFYHSASMHIAPFESTKMLEEYVDKQDYIAQKLLPFSTLINASMAIFKKELFLKVPPDYTNYRLVGDWMFWAEIGSMADVAISGKFFNYFRQHPVKVSQNTKKEGISYAEEIQALQYFRDKLQVSQAQYEYGIEQHYLRFKRDPMEFAPDVYQKIEQLFKQHFTPAVKKMSGNDCCMRKFFIKGFPIY